MPTLQPRAKELELQLCDASRQSLDCTPMQQDHDITYVAHWLRNHEKNPWDRYSHCAQQTGRYYLKENVARSLLIARDCSTPMIVRTRIWTELLNDADCMNKMRACVINFDKKLEHSLALSRVFLQQYLSHRRSNRFVRSVRWNIIS